MYKIITIIIMIFFYFSSFSNTYAQEWYIEKLLNLNYQTQELQLDLYKIDNIYFKTTKNNNLRINIQKTSNKLKKIFIQKYKNWELKYYELNWIITSYNNFVYHINKLLYFLKLEEQNCNFTETKTAIINNYIQIKSSFRKIQRIMK
jgi:hypothetical protein